jgi:ATP-dependent RNA helicase DDX31/DBP7
MLDMDFEKKINFIIFKLNQRRKEVEGKRPQTILISATLTSGIKEIARRMNVENPVDIDASTSSDLYGDDTVVSSKNEEKEKIALPSTLIHYYMTVPSKLRLVSLIAFVLGRLLVS